jgi:hypothetical protein
MLAQKYKFAGFDEIYVDRHRQNLLKITRCHFGAALSIKASKKVCIVSSLLLTNFSTLNSGLTGALVFIGPAGT